MTLQEAIDVLKSNRPPDGQRAFSMVREALDMVIPILDVFDGVPPAEGSALEDIHDPYVVGLLQAILAAHETEIEGARYVTDMNTSGETHLAPMVLVVGGPDRDDEIVLLAASECYLPRDVARKLAEEILRRLGQ